MLRILRRQYGRIARACLHLTRLSEKIFLAGCCECRISKTSRWWMFACNRWDATVVGNGWLDFGAAFGHVEGAEVHSHAAARFDGKCQVIGEVLFRGGEDKGKAARTEFLIRVWWSLCELFVWAPLKGLKSCLRSDGSKTSRADIVRTKTKPAVQVSWLI